MHYWFLGTLVLSMTLFPPSPPPAQALDAKPDPGSNAAMKYWQAFALMPALGKDEETLLEQWNKVPLDAAALKLIERSQGSLESLHRGAKLLRCDWSLDYEDGLYLRLPYLPKARTLAHLAALNARHEFEQGHGKAGWEDVTDLLKLGRHLEMEPLFIQRFVGRALESVAIDAAASYLPDLKSALPEAAYTDLDALPAAATLEQVVLEEKQVFLMSMIRKLKVAEQREQGSWRGIWKEMFHAILVSSEQKDIQKRDSIESVKTFEQAIKWLEDLLPFYDELAKMTALPWKEFDARFPDFAKRANAANPVADQILPMTDAMLATERRTLTRMEQFKAAVAVVQGGPDRLKDIHDPFGDGPFEYRALDKGFELKSKLLYHDKPVTLTVGPKQ
jgi:hypothetical protein